MISADYYRTRVQRLKFLAAIYLLWAGLVLGVSFIATPVKFQAPHLELATALEVGKVTFHLLNEIELILMISTCLLAAMSHVRWQPWFFLIPLSLLILSQKFWLLPALDVRTDIVIAGGRPSLGCLHWAYVALECLKLILLLVSAHAAARSSETKKSNGDRKP